MRFPTDGIVREADFRPEQVRFLYRRYSPDDISEIDFLCSPYAGAFFMRKLFTTKNIARIAIFGVLSFLLYLIRIPLPFLFPSFLELHVSEVPALMGGFMLGPLGGCLVILIKTALKLIFVGTSSGYIGELADIIIASAFVLPASLIYRKFRTKKGAAISLVAGSTISVIAALLANAYLLIPFYCKFYGMDAVVGLLKGLFQNVTEDSILKYYLPFSVLPFNSLRCVLSSTLTFFLYKRLESALDKLFNEEPKRLIKQRESCILSHMISTSEEQTFLQGEKLAMSLKGGEIILLSGDLGAGKTVFTKGIAKGLGITEEVTSPTFALLNVYDGGRLKLYHYDCYRLSSGQEAEERGLTEFFGDKDGVCVIEWPQVISDVLPPDVIEAEILYSGEGKREIKINDKQTKS